MTEKKQFVKDTIGVINIEIDWCKKNKGASQKGKDFERGFREGLVQAKRLIRLSGSAEE